METYSSLYVIYNNYSARTCSSSCMQEGGTVWAGVVLGLVAAYARKREVLFCGLVGSHTCHSSMYARRGTTNILLNAYENSVTIRLVLVAAHACKKEVPCGQGLCYLVGFLTCNSIMYARGGTT